MTCLVCQALQDFTAGLPTQRQQPRAERTDRESQPLNSQALLWQGLGMSGLKSPPGTEDHTGKVRAMPLPALMQRYDPEFVKPRTEYAQNAYYCYWRAANRQAPLMGRLPINWAAAKFAGCCAGALVRGARERSVCTARSCNASAYGK